MKLLHRLIPTNKCLCTCKIIDDSSCTFCNEDEETISHLFWNCDKVQRFWSTFSETLCGRCRQYDSLELTKELVLFGTEKNVKTDKVIDLFILFGKYYIFKCKIQKTAPTVAVFLTSLRQRYVTEKYSSYIRNRSAEFNQEWSPYIDLFSDADL